MLTANVLRRVVQIRWQNSTGSGFTVEISGRQYLLTAKHVIDGFAGGEIDIFDGSYFVPKNFELVGYSSDKDIAVLAHESQLTVTLPMPVSDKGMVLGQSAYFLGFPYGYAYINIQNGALPLVKSATVSAFNVDGRLVLDGHNNPGFSGGPVVFIPDGRQTRFAELGAFF
ncbi:MAG: trypsin-like peptidase domain-containing protein [Planctomycetaceae bacterium]|nr:trypsin-like peptidase domain-containing protein [Planctomycetaceae bacterium]